AARSVMALDRHRSRFAAADAQRGYALLQVVLPHGIDERRDDPRTRRTDRMAERARTTVNVHLVGRQIELLHRRHGDDREGLVDLVELDLFRGPAGLLIELPQRADRS